MSNVSHRPSVLFPGGCTVFIIVTFLQISKIPMILMTGHLIHIRRSTLLANSSFPILALQNGTRFTCLCSRTSVASGNALPFCGDTALFPLKHLHRALCGPET